MVVHQHSPNSCRIMHKIHFEILERTRRSSILFYLTASSFENLSPKLFIIDMNKMSNEHHICLRSREKGCNDPYSPLLWNSTSTSIALARVHTGIWHCPGHNDTVYRVLLDVSISVFHWNHFTSVRLFFSASLLHQPITKLFFYSCFDFCFI